MKEPRSNREFIMISKPIHNLIYFCLILLVLLFLQSRANVVRPACPQDVRICRFQLLIDYRFTMVLHDNNAGNAWQPVTAEEGGLYLKNAWDCSSRGPRLSDEDAERVITADGTYRRVLAVNDSVPGPAIVAYHGQQLEISVTNRLMNEVMTIHFHGLHQRGTPWMDGVAGVSQCPINPGETFTYRLIAEPSGTFWYHAHSGDQYSMGVHGPVIILDRTHSQTNAKRGSDPLPYFAAEFVAMVQDWEETESIFVTLLASHGFTGYSYGFDSEICYEPNLAADGIETAVNHFASGVVNGRGWRYINRTMEPVNSNLPLETFTVRRGAKYRFRLISSATVYGFRVSIDSHSLHVVAMDGHDVVTRTVDYVTIFPGERYDFYIRADDPAATGLYWMRFETLEYYDSDLNPILAHHVEAILRYEGSDDALPKTNGTVCTEENPCDMLNCPFQNAPAGDNLTCIHFTELRDPVPNTELWEIENTHEVEEHFLNFGFWSIGSFGLAPGVNGINNILGSAPVQVYAEMSDDLVIPCGCEDNVPCRCSHMIEIGLNSTVQLVLVSMPDMPLFAGTPHPIHIHGFTPQVVAVGWPQYDENSNLAVYGTTDISSRDGQGIYNYWTNNSWAGGNVPDMLGSSAPRKDTVIVPAGGYIVMRFRADNPGFWILHCHTEYHGVTGMAIIMKVGDVEDMSPAPVRMRRCGDFSISDEEFNQAIDKTAQYGTN